MPVRKVKSGYRYGKTGKVYKSHEGDTAAKTPYDCLHKLINSYCIKQTTLGGEAFDEKH